MVAQAKADIEKSIPLKVERQSIMTNSTKPRIRT